MSNSITGILKHGLEYKSKQLKDYKLNPVVATGDLFDAELEAGGVENQLAFDGALIARQLEYLGDLEGPFSLEQIRSLHPDDFMQLRADQGKLRALSSNTEHDEKTAGSE